MYVFFFLCVCACVYEYERACCMCICTCEGKLSSSVSTDRSINVLNMPITTNLPLEALRMISCLMS